MPDTSVPIATSSAATTSVTTTEDHVDAASRHRTFTVVGAPDAAPGRALLLVFHGSKQTGTIHRAFTGRALDTLAADGTAVVAYLDGYRRNWNDARRESSFPARLENVDDVAFARAVIQRLVATHGVDTRRVVAVGYSNGGQMVMRLLHEPGGLALATPIIAGAVVIAATMPDADGFLGEFSDAPGHRIPVALVAGTADRIVPYGGGRMARWARTVFKVDGTALSAPETAAYFARRNGITATPIKTVVEAASEGAASTSERRRDRAPMRRADFRAPGRASVSLFTVEGGGHTVPGPKRAPALLGRTGSAIGVADIVREVLGSVDEVGAMGESGHRM